MGNGKEGSSLVSIGHYWSLLGTIGHYYQLGVGNGKVEPCLVTVAGRQILQTLLWHEQYFARCKIQIFSPPPMTSNVNKLLRDHSLANQISRFLMFIVYGRYLLHSLAIWILFLFCSGGHLLGQFQGPRKDKEKKEGLVPPPNCNWLGNDTSPPVSHCKSRLHCCWLLEWCCNAAGQK